MLAIRSSILRFLTCVVAIATPFELTQAQDSPISESPATPGDSASDGERTEPAGPNESAGVVGAESPAEVPVGGEPAAEPSAVDDTRLRETIESDVSAPIEPQPRCSLGSLGCYLDADGRPRLVSEAYVSMRTANRRYPWRAFAWETLFLGSGTLWYWSDRRENSVDWDLHGWQQRFRRSAYRYDTNEFPMNFVFHPMAGNAFYGVARSNGLGILPSAAYAIGTSVSWEFFLEFRERVSLNDVLMTGNSGIVLGEFFYKLGRYLNSAPGGGGRKHRALAWSAGLPVAFHDWMNHRPGVPTSGARDALGFSADYWHRFRLSYGYVRGNPTDARTFDAHDFQFEGEIVAMPGYLREGEFRRAFFDGDRSRFRLQGMFGGGGPAWEVESDLVMLGFYRQRIAASDGGLQGHATLVGLDLGYFYRNIDLPRYTDRWASLHLPGLAIEHHFVVGPATIRVGSEASVDFSGVHANGYPQWQAQNPGETGKDVLEKQSYYYAWGGSVRGRVDVVLPFVELGARIHYGYANSREGLSRDQQSVTLDQHLHDTMFDVEGRLRLIPWRGLFVETSVLRQRRQSTIEDIHTQHGLVRTMFSVGILR